MYNYKITIELLSDLCVYDGGIYNSAIDTDICYDHRGFPYIPSKRIKGCLRESALELRDWGENIPIETLFGEGGDHEKGGKLKISDAILSEHEKYMTEIKDPDSLLFHPQNVLDHFSYIRTQTAIVRECDTTQTGQVNDKKESDKPVKDGTAKDGSLRTMRVANKGLKFTAPVELALEDDVKRAPAEKDEYIKKIMGMICSNMTGMGVSRTRGLGEVKVTFEDLKPCPGRGSEDTPCRGLNENATLLEYEFLLQSPVICKNVCGAEENTLDYIEGSKILGIIAGRYKKKGNSIIDLFGDKGPQFSNAYISEKGRRLKEVPGYIYSIKNDKTSYVNKLFDTDNKAREKNGEKRQLNRMKHTYVYVDKDGSLHKLDVDTEERYHHRRPDDKSIGKAAEDNTGNSMFYQISSISAGQSFRGFIKGSPEQITEIEGLLSADAEARIGYGSSSEYGKICFTECKPKVEVQKQTEVNDILVELEAPAIIYCDKAMYSTKTEDLVDEIRVAIGCESQPEIVQKYISYTTVGGYNVTWNRRKPTVTAFDKGTSLLLHFNEPVTIDTETRKFLGERSTEGYGEFTVVSFVSKEKAELPIYKKAVGNYDKAPIELKEGSFAADIASSLFGDFLKEKASVYAKDFSDAKYKPVVSNALIMCSENTTFEAVKEAGKARFEDKSSDLKSEKLVMFNNLLEKVNDKLKEVNDEKGENDKAENLVVEFEKAYGISNFSRIYGMEKIKYEFLRAFLVAVKYSIRAKEQKNGKQTDN